MAGMVNDNIVFPILDLIKREVSKTRVDLEDNPFDGVPSVELHRNDPLDDEKVTSADLHYAGGYMIDIYLTFGSEDESTYPVGVTPGNFDYDYYRYGRLTRVVSSAYDPNGDVIAGYSIDLFYDERGLLTKTEVARI